jgi:putative oxidoreductase
MEVRLQRLFSTFASGCPGVGLAVQRVVTSIALTTLAMERLTDASQIASSIPEIVGASAGMLLLVGFCTPFAGAVVVGAQLWAMLSHTESRAIGLILLTLGGTIAMIGPGAWSVDARLFGRKHIESSAR